jgi:hypothetical protein
MDRTNDPTRQDPQAGPAGMVPAAGKSAAQPSEAERIESLRDDPKKAAEPGQGEDRREGGLSGIA